MCCSILCGLLYRLRCCFWKIVPVLWIVDLGLTGYLIYGLYNADIFACCTTNMDPLSNVCGYDDLGGADNIFVDDYGYCGRKDTGRVCCEIGECAELEGIVDYNATTADYQCGAAYYGQEFGDTLCDEDLLDDISFYNYFWLNAVLITKCAGLIFLLLLEIRSCLKKVGLSLPSRGCTVSIYIY